MKKLSFLFFVLSFSFCSKEKHEYPRLIVPAVDDVVEVNTKHMLKSSPVLLGINFTRDTSIIWHKQRNLNSSIIDFQKDTLFPKYDLKIIIDTAYNFHYNEFEYEWIDVATIAENARNLGIRGEQFREILTSKYLDRIFRLREDQVAAYPVLIYNHGNINAYLKEVNASEFQLIQEAKDVDGRWKPIEYIHNLGSCILDYSYYTLKAKKYLATSIIKYDGGFKTKLRVKVRFGKHYY